MTTEAVLLRYVALLGDFAEKLTAEMAESHWRDLPNEVTEHVIAVADSVSDAGTVIVRYLEGTPQ